MNSKKEKIQLLRDLETGRKRISELLDTVTLPSWIDLQDEGAINELRYRFGEGFKIIERDGKRIVIGKEKKEKPGWFPGYTGYSPRTTPISSFMISEMQYK